MDKRNDGGLVYSTELGRMCPGCGKAVAGAALFDERDEQVGERQRLLAQRRSQLPSVEVSRH